MKRDLLYIFKKNILLSFALLMLYTGLMAQYCTPTTSGGSTYYITNFTITSDLGNLNNSSGNSPTGYTDFTAVPALPVTLGSLVPLQYSINASSGTYGYAIWIDYNQNGQFEASEQVLSTNSYTSPPMTGNFILSNMAIPGLTRMRIIAAWTPSNPSNPCVNSGSGEYEDYMINIIAPSPCSGTPAPGNTLSNANPVCPNTNFNLTLQNPPVESGLTFQWESANDAAFTVNLQTLGTNPMQTTSQMTAKYYRCLVTCTNSGLSAYSTPVQVTMTPIFNCYCASYATSTADEYIDTVRVGSFVNQSSGICSGYQNFTSSVPAPTFFLGQTYPSAIGTRDCEGSSFYTRYVEVYIDLNQDGVYSEPSEMVLGGQAVAANQSSVLGNITIPLTAQTGLTGMRVVCRESGDASSVTPCGTYSWGETEDYKVLLAPLPANDAGIASLISPSNPSASGGCLLDDTVKVSITTIGTTNLTSADVHVVVNSILVSTYNWTGNLSSNQTMNVAVGLVNLNDGDTVTVWVTNPNGVSDGFAFNDTARIIVHNALNGIYTVYGTTPDFATLNDAIDALTQRGTCADVTFNVRPGSYTEQVVIGTFPGAGNHTVTIQSETQNASDVRFAYLPNSSASNYVIAFTQTKNVILNHLTIANLSTTFSGVINFKGGNNNIGIQYCNIYGDSLANTTTTNKMTIGSLNGIDDNIHIEYNVIIGGSYGIYMAGNDSVNVESGLVITHNKLRRYYGAGIGAFWQSALTVNHNNLKSHSSNTNTNIFHMSLENVVNGTEVNGNTVVGNQGGFGINLVRIKAPFNTNSLIASNSVYMGSTSSPTNSHGIAIQNCSNVNVVFNSVHTRAATSTAAGIRIYNGQSSGINLLYNNIVNTGAGYAVNSESAIYIDQADYNNYYTGTSNFVKEGSSYANLTALQSGTGKETHSFSVDPYFNGADLHTCRIELDNVASPINGVIYDADMNARNTTTPDIGAYEFITANNFSLGSDIVKCPNDSVWIAAEQIQSASYYWSPFFQNTTGIYAIQAGTYIVQVIHSCGTSIDTVVVMNYPLPNAAFTYTLNYFTGSFNNNSSQATHYYWDFGDGNTSTDTNPNHVFPTNGTYTVTLTAYSDCGDSSVTSQIIVINPNVAGLDNEEDILLQVYPNPSTGIFAVDLSPVESHEVNITIYDLTGRMVHQVTHDSCVEGLHTMIDISGQAVGTYIMKINADNYQSTVRIIIK